MSIITYPLNGVTYSAEDVSTYLCTRTSGVYSKDTNFAVSVTGPRQITVAPGLAWINYDDFKGVSVCSREAQNLTIPESDSTLGRIDRVVLQFDTVANLTALKLKPGSPAADPKPPAILQNHNQYELGLCTVSVPAGSAVVTTGQITDTRLDEDLCGVMSDGVTGLPTAQLLTEARARIAEVEETASDSAAKAAASQSAAAQNQADAEAARDAAAGSAKAAKTSETNSGQSAEKAATSEGNAKASEEASKASEEAAAESEAAAKASQEAAATSEANALKYSQEAGATAGTDKTLSIEDAPADAKQTGEALSERYTKAETIQREMAYCPRKGAVPSNDFDQATVEGLYTYVNDLTNGYTASDAGTLLVYNSTINSSADDYGVWVYQVAYPVNGKTPWTRTRTDGNAWTEWKQLASTVTSGGVYTDDYYSAYIRFENGMQLCWGRTTINGAISSTNKQVNFVVPFVNYPAVLTTLNANVHIDTKNLIGVGWETTTGFTIGQNYDGTSTGTTSRIAVGNWK